MHTKFVLKQLSRGWVKSVLWIMLLAAVICFITVSAGQWYVSRQNLKAMDQIFTTVAVVDDTDFWRSNVNMYRVHNPDGRVEYYGVDKSGDIPDPESSLREIVEKLTMVELTDNRQSSRAFSPDIFSIVHPLEPLEAAIAREEADRSGDFHKWQEVIARFGQPFDYWSFQEGIASAALTAKCVNLEMIMPDELNPRGILSYVAVFEINHGESPVIHPFHLNFKYLRIAKMGILPNYQLPFTVGQDYLLATEWLDPRVYNPDHISDYGIERGLVDLCSEPGWFLEGSLQGNRDLLLDVPGNMREFPGFTGEELSEAWKSHHSPFTVDAVHTSPA